MRSPARIITFIVFLLIAGGSAFAVLSLGTSTGIAMGGTGAVIGTGSDEEPLYAQAGWVRNNSAWPIEIDAVTLNHVGATTDPEVYFSSTKPDKTVQGDAPDWASAANALPYTIEGGALRYFGFALTPASGRVASFDTITLKFSGPLGLSFDASYTGVAVVANAADLPFELASVDPASEGKSLDGFLSLYRAVYEGGDIESLRVLLGSDATEDAATALRKSQRGYRPDMLFSASRETTDGRSQKVVFFRTDPETDGLVPLRFTWANFRWTVSIAQ